MLPKPTRRAVIDVGHKCNVKCKQCYHWHENDQSFKSPDMLKREIMEAKSRGNNYIDFTGGEPTIYPDMPEVIKFCVEQGLKTCIITNGIAGAGATKAIIDAGIDDWLVSVHGTEAIHDEIVQLPGARKLQDRFLKQIAKEGDFRMNCTITRWNQQDLVGIATYAAKFKPRIFNFINFNPHGDWQKDLSTTRDVMADLDVVETQINEAVSILIDAGAGVNLRYYPMCKISEAYRHTVCNDVHVMFDPYEWDYGITPKTFKAYSSYGTKMSNCNEWKGQPCQACDLRYICGGINSTFYKASGMKFISAVKAPDAPRDDIYYYRRKNTICLTDRFPKADATCIATIADENMRHYVPLFLYAAYKAYPDCDIKVFARYHDHAILRDTLDPIVGYGFYDSCVVQVADHLCEYAADPSITRAVRFVEFENLLSQYSNVLWTDVDILLADDGDFVKRHREQMGIDGTECYENWVTIHEGKARLCGVHFCTKEWWEKTRAQREQLAEKLKEMNTADYEFDEQALMQIVEGSGLKVSPSERRLWRHHGVHFGDWRYARKSNSSVTLSEMQSKAIQALLCDKGFRSMAQEAGAKCDDIQKTVGEWTKGFTPKNSRTALALNKGGAQSTYSTGPAPSTVPAKQPNRANKKYVIKNYTGKTCIFTICDEMYQWYIPLFLYSLRRAYPDNVPRIKMRGAADPQMIELCGTASYVEPFIQTDIPQSGYATAALRFLLADGFEDFDYTLITDVDMLIYKEEMSIIDQHMMHMTKDNTRCYENWVSETRGGQPRLPGVHFVTKEWWSTARAAASEELKRLQALEAGDIEYCYDEMMLGRIVQASGLPLPPAAPKMWRHHAIHLGDWRLNIARKQLPRPNVFEKMHINSLLTDSTFMALAAECGKRIPLITEVVKKWPLLFK